MELSEESKNRSPLGWEEILREELATQRSPSNSEHFISRLISAGKFAHLYLSCDNGHIRLHTMANLQTYDVRNEAIKRFVTNLFLGEGEKDDKIAYIFEEESDLHLRTYFITQPIGVSNPSREIAR